MQLTNVVVGGDFRVIEPLGRGGMGEVHVALQESTGQKRALKLMHPMLVEDPKLRERFEQEARIGGQIASEHVVRVIAAGVDSALGMPWIAMELLGGEDLAAFGRRRGAISMAELLPIFRQLCHALGAAHDVGIVHRDVKPENVYLARVHSADTEWQIRVLDFGIAKFVADAKQASTGQIGTPLWMSPEQGESVAPVTPAADVWPLGLLAFWLLTGRYYWRTANQENAGLSALFRETLFEPIVPASQRAAELGVGGRIPPGFDAWFARALQRDPAQRFAHAREAFQALESSSSLTGTAPSPGVSPASAPSAQASFATSASPPTTPPARSRLGWILALGAGVLLVGAIGLFAILGVGAYFALGESSVKPPAVAATESPASPTVSAGATGEVPSVSAPGVATPAPRTASGAPTTATKATSSPTAAESVAAAGAPVPEEKKSTLQPIDRAATQSKVNSVAASATTSCASQKAKDAATESYSGTLGFRPDGSGTGSMMGTGGARECVKDKVLSLRIGKYEHPQEWHVESFSWSVTIK